MQDVNTAAFESYFWFLLKYSCLSESNTNYVGISTGTLPSQWLPSAVAGILHGKLDHMPEPLHVTVALICMELLIIGNRNGKGSEKVMDKGFTKKKQ